MKKQGYVKALSIFVCMCILLTCMPSAAALPSDITHAKAASEPPTATDDTAASSCAYSAMESNKVYFMPNLDLNAMHRYDNSLMEFEIEVDNLHTAEEIVLQITSTISVDTGNTPIVLSADNNSALLQIVIQEPPLAQTIDSLQFETIVITGISQDSGREYIPTVIHVLHTQYGVFIGFINEECLYNNYVKWLKDQNYLSEYDYFLILNDATKATTGTIAQQSQTRDTKTSYTSGIIHGNYKVTRSNNTYVISGTVYWVDLMNNSHPLNNTLVEVKCIDPYSPATYILVSCYTTDSGFFVCSFTSDLSFLINMGCFFQIQLAAKTSAVSVGTAPLVAPYYVSIDIGNLMNTGTNAYLPFSKTPTNATKALCLAQAFRTGQLFVEDMTDTAPALISVAFPSTELVPCFYAAGVINITESNFQHWDVLLHEYGHYVADLYDITDFIAGNHYLDSNLIDTGYSHMYANRLAWAEGWANYFSVSSQIQQQVSSLSIPYAGDGFYNTIGPAVGIEANNHRYNSMGEAHEIAVMRVLWDMLDSEYTVGSTQESFDNLSLGFYTVWSYCNNFNGNTLSDFVNYYMNSISRTSNAYKQYGGILASHKVAASPSYLDFPSPFTVCFTFSTPYTSSYVVNYCGIVIFDLNMNIVYSTPTSNVPGSSMGIFIDEYEWEYVRNVCASGYYWCVKTEPAGETMTGPYYSQIIPGSFFS